ncbi:hypothetical protein NHJ6243_009775 [Beauveria neobassiana]
MSRGRISLRKGRAGDIQGVASREGVRGVGRVIGHTEVEEGQERPDKFKRQRDRVAAERLQNYHSKLQGLVAAISESNNFYSVSYDQAQGEGAESAAAIEATIQPCNEVYALVQVKLGEAQKLAKESGIRVYLLQQQVVCKKLYPACFGLT